MTGSSLTIYTNITRADDGDYHCVSYNKHGNHSAVTRMNVLCKCIEKCTEFLVGFKRDFIFSRGG